MAVAGGRSWKGDRATGAGTYTLLIELDGAGRIGFGAAGERDLAAGWYAYTGSALGPGGLARVERHRRVATGENDTRHWHVDYLLGHPRARIASVARSPGVDAECRIAGALAGTPVPGIGASDCGCDAHLVLSTDRGSLRRSIEAAHGGTVGDRLAPERDGATADR